MSLKKEPLYSLADISTIPCCTTDIESRSECDCYGLNLEGNGLYLPIIVSPMSCNYVGGTDDVQIYRDSKVNTVVPRTIDPIIRKKMASETMTAFSLSEATEFLENDYEGNLYICIDMANGHMEKQINLGKSLKEKYGDRLKLMGGNIANPKSYIHYAQAGFDYLRVGIGGGNACFLEGTKITMSDGTKVNIEDIKEGDEVMTKDGPHFVTNVIVQEADRYFIVNGEIKCTPDHEFFVTDKDDTDLAVGKWVPISEIYRSPNYRLTKLRGYKTVQVPIESIEVKLAIGKNIKVFDIEVQTEHSYIAEDYIVHNCLTSTQSSVHYPMASLLDDINEIRRANFNYRTKVIADGGISGYSDAIKCLALGADYVMMGKVFTKACLHGEKIGSEVSYYGMSTKKAQREMGGPGNKTSEGRDLKLNKEYTLSGWVENFTDYLKSAMSYTNARDLETFRSCTTCQVISPNSSYAINNK